jgi:hypothetical protein
VGSLDDLRKASKGAQDPDPERECCFAVVLGCCVLGCSSGCLLRGHTSLAGHTSVHGCGIQL